MIQLSVIIVNYNVQHFLKQCLLSIRAASTAITTEIIVVDNNSSDRSCTMIKDKFPRVLLIENKVNLGFSKANNQGVTKAKGEYVLTLNPDTLVGEDTLDKVLTFAIHKKDCGAVGVKLIDGTGNFLPESKRNLPTPRVALKKVFGNTSKYYVKQLGENEIGKAPMLVGAFMLMKRSIYNQVGGFDEDYFMYGEDIDLSYKILKAGYTNYYYGNTTTIHYKGESTKKDANYLKHFHGAMEIFYKKHFKGLAFKLLIIQLGIWGWYVLNFFRLSAKEQISIKPKHIIYLGNSEDRFQKIKRRIASETQASSVSVKIEIQNSLEGLNSIVESSKADQIVFDADYLSNQEIIETIQKHKNRGISFRIFPIMSDFYLGGDSANSRGEVVKFS